MDRTLISRTGAVVGIVALGITAAAGASAQATMISFATPTGARAQTGEPVDALTTFVTGTNTVTVTLYNLESGIRSIDQNLSDVTFALSNGKTNATILSSTGLSRTVHANGSFTDGAAGATGWRLGVYNKEIVLDDGWYTGAGPARTILGPPTGLTYPYADSSIAGGKSNNPFLAGPVTFQLTVPGVTAATTITDVSFYFGTCEQCVTGRVAQVPEPATWIIASLAIGGLAIAARRRTRLAASCRRRRGNV